MNAKFYVAGAGMLNFFVKLFDTDFMPHGMCYFWRPGILWLHSLSDGLIAVSYFLIPVMLVQIVRKRRNLSFHWMFWMFAAFILLCGSTHVLNILTIWRPVYRLDGFVKLLTGIVSIATAAYLFRLIPRILAIPMPDELSAANRALAHQISINRKTEENLRELNADLGRRVSERTAALERSNQELSQFAYVASHDLQEPLRMISNYTELLQRRYASDLSEEAQVFMNYAIDGARRMQDLVTDLLDYAQIGRETTPLGELHAGSAVQAALQSLHLAISDEQAEITVQSLPVVLGDETQIAQLFQNLISNSLKYRAAERPRIQISAVPDAASNRWRFLVKDNGKGFDAKYKHRLFGMFQRLDTDQPGTGIGLALCKKIVQYHGGQIDIDSQVGVGTTVSFTLSATKGTAKII